jgi:hypothetical protein
LFREFASEIPDNVSEFGRSSRDWQRSQVWRARK